MDAAALPSFSVSPNPSTGVVRINGIQSGRRYTAFLYDCTGRLVLEQEVSGSGTLQLENAPKAVYLLKVRDLISGVAVPAGRVMLY